MHFLSLNDLSANEIHNLVDRSSELARAFRNNEVARPLVGKRIGLVVDDSGWRNTSALDLGAQMLGATLVTIPVSLGMYEDIPDLARYFSNWFNLIAVRTPSLRKLRQLSESSDIPIVNLRTAVNHPCETLGDLSFIKSVRGDLEKLTVVVVAPAANIIHSWAEAACILPITLIQIAPSGFEIDRKQYPGADIRCVGELSALEYADVIITDCWPSEVPKETILRLQITSELLDKTSKGCLFIPCPPVTRGAEVSEDAMTHKKCVVYSAKDHLLHAQNALLEHLLR